ncbi:hypothetical protein LWM68_09565 [Niabella sp. W65]|nr:hypothetical protein [Niabella sp. W65]MCH7362994.1 hypothetical protein [Niabella sp. W65]ULT38931.1 hypothetical protein KRR40_28235 [Niabella sp. I65]
MKGIFPDQGEDNRKLTTACTGRRSCAGAARGRHNGPDTLLHDTSIVSFFDAGYTRQVIDAGEVRIEDNASLNLFPGTNIVFPVTGEHLREFLL